MATLSSQFRTVSGTAKRVKNTYFDDVTNSPAPPTKLRRCVAVRRITVNKEFILSEDNDKENVSPAGKATIMIDRDDEFDFKRQKLTSSAAVTQLGSHLMSQKQLQRKQHERKHQQTNANIEENRRRSSSPGNNISPCKNFDLKSLNRNHPTSDLTHNYCELIWVNNRWDILNVEPHDLSRNGSRMDAPLRDYDDVSAILAPSGEYVQLFNKRNIFPVSTPIVTSAGSCSCSTTSEPNSSRSIHKQSETRDHHGKICERSLKSLKEPIPLCRINISRDSCCRINKSIRGNDDKIRKENDILDNNSGDIHVLNDNSRGDTFFHDVSVIANASTSSAEFREQISRLSLEGSSAGGRAGGVGIERVGVQGWGSGDGGAFCSTFSYPLHSTALDSDSGDVTGLESQNSDAADIDLGLGGKSSDAADVDLDFETVKSSPCDCYNVGEQHKLQQQQHHQRQQQQQKQKRQQQSQQQQRQSQQQQLQQQQAKQQHEHVNIADKHNNTNINVVLHTSSEFKKSCDISLNNSIPAACVKTDAEQVTSCRPAAVTRRLTRQVADSRLNRRRCRNIDVAKLDSVQQQRQEQQQQHRPWRQQRWLQQEQQQQKWAQQQHQRQERRALEQPSNRTTAGEIFDMNELTSVTTPSDVLDQSSMCDVIVESSRSTLFDTPPKRRRRRHHDGAMINQSSFASNDLSSLQSCTNVSIDVDLSRSSLSSLEDLKEEEGKRKGEKPGIRCLHRQYLPQDQVYPVPAHPFSGHCLVQPRDDARTTRPLHDIAEAEVTAEVGLLPLRSTSAPDGDEGLTSSSMSLGVTLLPSQKFYNDVLLDARYNEEHLRSLTTAPPAAASAAVCKLSPLAPSSELMTKKLKHDSNVMFYKTAAAAAAVVTRQCSLQSTDLDCRSLDGASRLSHCHHCSSDGGRVGGGRKEGRRGGCGCVAGWSYQGSEVGGMVGIGEGMVSTGGDMCREEGLGRRRLRRQVATADVVLVCRRKVLMKKLQHFRRALRGGGDTSRTQLTTFGQL